MGLFISSKFQGDNLSSVIKRKRARFFSYADSIGVILFFETKFNMYERSYPKTKVLSSQVDRFSAY